MIVPRNGSDQSSLRSFCLLVREGKETTPHLLHSTLLGKFFGYWSKFDIGRFVAVIHSSFSNPVFP